MQCKPKIYIIRHKINSRIDHCSTNLLNPKIKTRRTTICWRVNVKACINWSKSLTSRQWTCCIPPTRKMYLWREVRVALRNIWLFNESYQRLNSQPWTSQMSEERTQRMRTRIAAIFKNLCVLLKKLWKFWQSSTKSSVFLLSRFT